MKIIHGIAGIEKIRKAVVALGIFDGLHLGHRHIIKAAVGCARRIKGTSVVITFHPHPQGHKSIYSLQHRLRMMVELGVGVCIVIPFTKRFADLSALDFIKGILAHRLHARWVYVGENFRFGRHAAADVHTLRQFSGAYGFGVRSFAVIKVNSLPISSTTIRRLITTGKLKNAERLLARPVSILGTVIRGQRLGRRLGFPTANINPHHEVLPPSGVYAVRALWRGKRFSGACYIGKKPTFSSHHPGINPWGSTRLVRKQKKTAQKVVEVHIFNLRKRLYGDDLEIQFVTKLRKDKKFSSVYDLARQIQKDVLSTRKVFARHY